MDGFIKPKSKEEIKSVQILSQSDSTSDPFSKEAFKQLSSEGDH